MLYEQGAAAAFLFLNSYVNSVYESRLGKQSCRYSFSKLPNKTVSFFLFRFVKIILLKSDNCALTLRKRLFCDAKPTLLPCKTAAFGTQNNRFCNALINRGLCNRIACEKYLHSCCLLQRCLYCRNGNKKGLQIQITVYLKTLCLDVRINLIQ